MLIESCAFVHNLRALLTSSLATAMRPGSWMDDLKDADPMFMFLETTRRCATIWRCGLVSAWMDYRSVQTEPQCLLLTGSLATAMRPGWTTWRTPTLCRFVSVTVLVWCISTVIIICLHMTMSLYTYIFKAIHGFN